MEIDIGSLYKSVTDNKETSIEEKQILLDEIRKLKPASDNRWNFRYVIWSLALVALASPLILISLAIRGEVVSIPEGIMALSSTSVGALAAFVTSTLKK